jgi:Ran GTPase-activating protein (RanGAP) involved in mRNA processing and transport
MGDRYDERLERNPHALNLETNTKVKNTKYPDVDETAHMDLSDQKLHCRGLMSIISDLNKDQQLLQVDLSYNINLEEAFQPKRMGKMCDALVRMLKFNKTLTALDLVGNHLGNFGPHPLNEQMRDIVLEIAKALPESSVVRLDISDNALTGTMGRKLTALGYYSRHFIKTHGKYFLARSNLLQSQALVMIANGMGHGSRIEYLDLNDNMVGLDPSGLRNSEGIQRFSVAAQQTLTLRVLKLARNSLTDEDIECLCISLAHVPTLQVLDLAGNFCHGVGMEFVKDLILSHAVLDLNRGLGLRDLDISFNPIGDLGVMHLNNAIPRTFTLEALSVRSCEIPTESMYQLCKTMKTNSLLRRFECDCNPADVMSTNLAYAEGAANLDLWRIQQDPQSVNPSAYLPYMYEALRHKLKFLPRETLYKLHDNPHFMVNLSGMKESLFVVAPPSRTYQFSEVVEADPKYRARLEASKEMDRRVQAALKIFHKIMKWWHHLKEARRIKEVMLERQRQLEEEERLQLELQGLA